MDHTALYKQDGTYEPYWTPHHDFEFHEYSHSDATMFSGAQPTGHLAHHYQMAPMTRYVHDIDSRPYHLDHFGTDTVRFLGDTHTHGIVHHPTKPYLSHPKETSVLGYPTADRDDLESNSSGKRSYGDDPLSPNVACTPYYGPVDTNGWSQSMDTTPMPFSSPTTLHTGGSFTVNPRDVAAQDLPGDQPMDDDLDADGEIDTDLRFAYASLENEDVATPELINGPSSDDDDPPYEPRNRGKRPQRRSALRPPVLQNDTASTARTPKTIRRNRKGTALDSKKRPRSTPGNARPFPCPLTPYGCNATFASKNEWKRHVSTQHVKAGFWRCELCQPTPPSGSHNDFNRKDLFTQHLKRMHASTLANDSVYVQLAAELASTEEPGEPIMLRVTDRSGDEYDVASNVITELVSRCFVIIRALPDRCQCPIGGCDKLFRGTSAWDERMEHLASHLERGKRTGGRPTGVEAWTEDGELSAWLVEEGLVEQDARGRWRLGDGRPRRESQFDL